MKRKEITNAENKEKYSFRKNFGNFNEYKKRPYNNIKENNIDSQEEEDIEDEKTDITEELEEPNNLDSQKDEDKKKYNLRPRKNRRVVADSNNINKNKNKLPSFLDKKPKLGKKPPSNKITLKSSPKLPNCSICLDEIKILSTISECQHNFCFECLSQWVEKSSSCPLCRKEFTKFSFIDEKNNKKIKEVVPKQFEDFEYEFEDEFWYDNSADNCMVCKNTNNTHLMLVCDNCNYNVCHTYCTNLDRIPDGDWICQECIVRKYEINSKDVDRVLKILNEESDEEK